MARYDFASDNVAGAMPEVMEALVSANAGTASGYGTDHVSQAAGDSRTVSCAPFWISMSAIGNRYTSTPFSGSVQWMTSMNCFRKKSPSAMCAPGEGLLLRGSLRVPRGECDGRSGGREGGVTGGALPG